jgi:hypothetical protein
MGLQKHALAALEDILPNLARYNASWVSSDEMWVDVSDEADINDVMYGIRVEFNAVITSRSENGILIKFRPLPRFGGPKPVIVAPWMETKPGYKWVKSALNGHWCQIAEDTPFCADPSTETYWSM